MLLLLFTSFMYTILAGKEEIIVVSFQYLMTYNKNDKEEDHKIAKQL